MAETIILDPSELATGRTQLDITPWVSLEGLDWGDAEVSAYSAETLRGEVPVDFRIPNRQISGPLMFSETKGGTTTRAARAAIQAKLALFQREGGWVKRITNAGGTVYADVVNATFRATSVSGWESREEADIGASFTIETLPDFYEDEVTDSDNSTTTARELIFTKTMTGQGDQPNRVRLVVDNDGTTDWRGLIWAFRSRHYSSATTAQVEYEAEELQALDTAAATALTGASGGTVVRHGTLSTSWTPVVGTNIGGTSYLTHTGTYRVWARIYSTSGTTVQSRLVYDVGDLVNPTENTSFRLPGASNFYIKDYGEIRLDQAPVGTHRWQGQIQAKGDSGGENFSVDKVWLQNLDEGAGVLKAPATITEGLVTYSARSEFTSESGAITGDSLAVGGTWTGAGDTDDLSESGDTAVRTATSDSGSLLTPESGRIVTASTPTTMTNTVVRIDFKVSTYSADTYAMLVARYTNINNFFAIGFAPVSTSAVNLVQWKRASSSTTTTTLGTLAGISLNTFYSAYLVALANGTFGIFFGPQGGASLVHSGFDSALVTGGALASGAPGFGDFHPAADGVTRTYDNFAAWAPSTGSGIDAIGYAGQSVQLGTDGILREDAGGTAYAPVSEPLSDLPRFPVGYVAGGTVETLLVPSEGDFASLPDGTAATRSISARAYRRPGWLFVDDT